jgi:DNA-binding response OmpR family regulator
MPEALRSRRILLIEDEYFLADDLERALRAEGAEVIGPVSSVFEARSLIDDRLDGAVLDIKLQDGEVYEIADELSRMLVPFAFATGYDAEIIPRRFQNTARVEKPFEAETAVEVIKGLLKGRC